MILHRHNSGLTKQRSKVKLCYGSTHINNPEFWLRWGKHRRDLATVQSWCWLSTSCHHNTFVSIYLGTNVLKGFSFIFIRLHDNWTKCNSHSCFLSIFSCLPSVPGVQRPPVRVLRSCHSLTNFSRFFQINSWPDRAYQLQGAQMIMGNEPKHVLPTLSITCCDWLKMETHIPNRAPPKWAAWSKNLQPNTTPAASIATMAFSAYGERGEGEKETQRQWKGGERQRQGRRDGGGREIDKAGRRDRKK